MLSDYANDDLQSIHLTSEQIQTRIAELGREISGDYAGRNPLVIGVLKGVLFFMADLLHNMQIPLEVDFMAITSYSPEAREQGVVRLVKDLDISLTGRHVLFVEDVVDTGLTLNYLLRNLRARQPASLEVVTLFNKPERRLLELPIKYVGFNLPDLFVVGYGLDYREQYRNLPYIGVLKASKLNSSDSKSKAD